MPTRHAFTKPVFSGSGHWLLLACTLVLTAPSVHAQQVAQKKLYCWNDTSGARVCGDTLPSNAVDQAHDEFSATNGRHTARVARAPTAEELAASVAAARQQQEDAAAADARKRTDQAMLASYDNEADLNRVFDEQRAMIDNDIKTARSNIDSEREGLQVVLRQAGDKELSGGKVDAKAIAGIHQRHAALLQAQALEADYEQKRKGLDVQATDALTRYRKMKGITNSNTTVLPATTASAASPPVNTAHR